MRIRRIPPVLPRLFSGPITLTACERRAMYGRALLRLNGLDAVEGAIQDKEWENAASLGQEFSDLLAFLCTDLGWEPNLDSEVILSTPTGALRGAVEALARQAHADAAIFEEEMLGAKHDFDAAKDVLQICRRIEAALSGRK